jgi:hypothetical protein
MPPGGPQAFAVFTVCNLAYLPRALVLAESLSAVCAARLRIYLVDRKVDLDASRFPADVTWIEDVGVPGLSHLAFKYDITELSTSLKPFLALGLLERFEKVIFLDPDTCLYGPIEPILDDLDRHSILLTPHYVTPQPDDLETPDLMMMRFGSFNLGFFGVRRADQSLRFLRWWSDRCLRFGFFETQFGLSTDQKWASIVPCFFDDLGISFHLGYNVAFWNLHERSLARDVAGRYLVNGRFPLVFFHFSSFDEAHPEMLTRRPLPDAFLARAGVSELATAYQRALAARKSSVPFERYGFDYMSDGAYISPTLRRAYACVSSEFPPDHDPFDARGVVGTFARKNFLLEGKQSPYVPSGLADAGTHARTLGFAYAAMRLMLRVMGPNRFANLSRLLVYLSSYRLHRGLWRL